MTLPKLSLQVLNLIRIPTCSQQPQHLHQLKNSCNSFSTLPRHQHINPVKMNIFPDSGASVCLAGPQHIAKFNLDTHDLIPCYKQVKAVGGSKLICHGWLPITFRIGKNTTKQPVYICDKVDRLCFGEKGCVDVNILSQVFPFPMNSS